MRPISHQSGGVLATHTEESHDAEGAGLARRLMSRPSSASAVATLSITKRVWNAPPADLFPDVPGSTSKGPSRKRATTAVIASSAAQCDSSAPVGERRATALVSRAQSSILNPSTQQRMSLVSPNRNRRLAGTGERGAAPQPPACEPTASTSSISGALTHRNRHSVIENTAPSDSKRVSFLTEVPTSRHSSTASASRPSLAQISTPRTSRRPTAEIATSKPQSSSQPTQGHGNDRKKLAAATIANDLDSRESKREALKSAFVLRSMKRQDVDADDVRPLIEIAYWSPFFEVRRDAAAALASLSRNCT